MILIIGATGTVGTAICDAVIDKSQFRLALRDPNCGPAGFASVPFDLARPQAYAAALDGVSRLFLLFPPQVSISAAAGRMSAIDRKRTLAPRLNKRLLSGEVPFAFNVRNGWEADIAASGQTFSRPASNGTARGSD